ncbi:MAG: hypothetical protein AAF797_11855 [Planctomycetota bacterium]
MKQRDYSYLVVALVIALCTGCSSGTTRIIHADRHAVTDSVKQFLIKDGFTIDKERDDQEEYRLTASSTGGFIFPHVHRFAISVKEGTSKSSNTSLLTIKDRGYVPFPFSILTLGINENSNQVEESWLKRFEETTLKSLHLPANDVRKAIKPSAKGTLLDSPSQTKYLKGCL